MKSIIVSFLLLACLTVKAQGSIAVPISTSIFYGNQDEWIHLKITDTLTQQVWYDTMATVSVTNGFVDTVYLDSATYKCEVLTMGANVHMPDIKLDDGSLAVWGYPDYEYYLFTLPVPKSEASISEETESSQILVFPNPATNTVQIEIPPHLVYGELKVLDNLGRVIHLEKMNGNTMKNLDVTDFSVGIYYVQIDFENQCEITKLVKGYNN